MTKLYDKRDDYCILYCQFSLHLWQHPFSTCIWSFLYWNSSYARAYRNNAEFFNRSRLLTMRLRNRVMLLKVITTEVVWSSSWIAIVYTSVRWELLRTACHGILFLFRLFWFCFFISNSEVFLEKQRTFIQTGAPYPCSQFLVDCEYLIYFS